MEITMDKDLKEKKELEKLLTPYEEKHKEKRIYTREELESILEPSVRQLSKKDCPPGKDIVQVTLPWLDEANDCIEVYLIRDKDGNIKMEQD